MKSLILVLSFQAVVLNAQAVSDDPARPVLGKTGEVFSLKITPGSRRLDITLAGTPAATLDPEKLSVFGKIYPLKGESKTLRIEARNGYFEILDKIEDKATIEIEVKDKSTSKTETLRLRQHARP
jgi:hypothetical protein